MLGAEWGGWRPLIQKGWIPTDGSSASWRNDQAAPLYCGRHFGRHPHRVGVEGADLIVAINTDRNAPIFDFPHVGIVADATKVLPALTETFRKRLALAATRSAAESELHQWQKKNLTSLSSEPVLGQCLRLVATRGLKILQLERGEYPGSKNVQGAILYANALEKIIPDFPRMRRSNAISSNSASG